MGQHSDISKDCSMLFKCLKMKLGSVGVSEKEVKLQICHE